MGSAGHRNIRQTFLEGLRLSFLTAPGTGCPGQRNSVHLLRTIFLLTSLQAIWKKFLSLSGPFSPEDVLGNREQLLVDWPELSSMGGAGGRASQCPPRPHPANQEQKLPRGQSLAYGLTVRKQSGSAQGGCPKEVGVLHPALWTSASSLF